MRIAMPRGDIKWQRFMVNAPNGMSTDVDFTSIYFTVKKNPKDRTYMFQKSLKRGEIYKLGPGDYQFKIDSKDTMKMIPGDYTFDIQLGYKNLLKETFAGEFVLKPEVTYPENEDDEEEEEAEFTLPSVPERSSIVLEVPDYHIIELATPLTVSENLSYNALSDKPTIEGVELSGDLKLEDFGLLALTNDELEDIIKEDNSDERVSE